MELQYPKTHFVLGSSRPCVKTTVTPWELCMHCIHAHAEVGVQVANNGVVRRRGLWGMTVHGQARTHVAHAKQIVVTEIRITAV